MREDDRRRMGAAGMVAMETRGVVEGRRRERRRRGRPASDAIALRGREVYQSRRSIPPSPRAGRDGDTLAGMTHVEVLRNPLAESAATPWDLLAAWPQDRPIALLNRGEGADPLPRWTLVTEPESVSTLPAARSAPSAGDATLVSAWLAEHLPAGGLGDTATIAPDTPPWATGTIALLAYELGRRLEPAATKPERTPSPTSKAGDARHDWDVWIARAEWSVVFDHRTRRWHRAGPVPAWAEGSLVRAALADADARRFHLGSLRPNESDERFATSVERCVGLVHAGDLFQANLSRGFEAEFDGDPRGLAAATLAGGARFGAYVEASADEAILSLSPELHFAVEREGVVRTCPIKGTRPAGADLAAFAGDAKDAAELAMIVDLMRNDLGRVCRPGSIRVVEARRFEHHPTIVHGVAEIEGRLRGDVGACELLAATFPAGSITGAPKIRAMQVIETLENAHRGIYCGGIGWFDATRGAMLNVAIRTATLRRVGAGTGKAWRLDYRAGCGIVADSDPTAEALESRDKTTVLARHAAGVMRRVEDPTPDAVAPRSRPRPDDRPDRRVRRPR